MTTRTNGRILTFAHPFLLKGVDRELPAGDYRVVTDEELIEGLSFSGLPSHFNHDLRSGAKYFRSRDGDR